MTNKIQKRIESKRMELQTSLFDSITNFLFMKRAHSMVADRAQLIFQFVDQRIANEEDLGVFFQSDKIY